MLETQSSKVSREGVDGNRRMPHAECAWNFISPTCACLRLSAVTWASFTQLQCLLWKENGEMQMTHLVSLSSQKCHHFLSESLVLAGTIRKWKCQYWYIYECFERLSAGCGCNACIGRSRQVLWSTDGNWFPVLPCGPDMSWRVFDHVVCHFQCNLHDCSVQRGVQNCHGMPWKSPGLWNSSVRVPVSRGTWAQVSRSLQEL